MKITTCYTVPVKAQLYKTTGSDGKPSERAGKVNDSLMRATSGICLDALKLCVDVFLKEWDYISSFPKTAKKGVTSRRRAGDLLVHSTNKNTARYPEFDERFRNFPAYMRRAVIADALGMVSSYMSNHASWEGKKPDERGEEPTLGMPDRYELTFYEQERDLEQMDKGVISLKLYDGRAWNWFRFRINPSDARYVGKMRKSRTILSPVVEKVHGQYKIRFSFEETKTLVSDEDPLSHTILAVDLGIHSPASWCVMESDGTVHARGVVRLACEEGRLNHLVNRKRMYQSAGKKSRSIYRMVNAANRELSIATCREIMRVADLYNVDCIVFEHLDTKGSIKGRKYRERIHLWRAREVQDRVELQAHRRGMRISRICAWGTSKLAFDGSGAVIRGKAAGFQKNNICRFPSGKVYNCDISASLNIGARFFLREYAKRYPGLELPKTPQRTYSTLYNLVRGISA